MKLRHVLPAILVVVQLAHSAFGATLYSDPLHGRTENPGTAESPWPALAEATSSGMLAALKGGDTLLLKDGPHGDVRLAGENAGMVTVAAAPGASPQLERLTILSGANWTFRGLSISPSFASSPYQGYIVSVAEKGPGRDIVIEDCFVFSTEDTASWTAADWIKANSGILLGRHGRNLTLRNNYVLNTRFGIGMSAPDSLCEGNVVSDFSADGIRITRDNATVAWNVVKNVYVSSADGDKNHDDAIQCFLFNKGTGTVRKVKVHHNLLFMREDPQQPFPAHFQGIGFFDGPLVDFVVEKNVVTTAHYHGISLYDAQNCRISDNVVFNPWGGKMNPWIMLGTKLQQAHGNTVENNRAHAFKFQADSQVTAAHNEPAEAKIHQARSEALLAEIGEKFGKIHPVAQRGRLAPLP